MTVTRFGQYAIYKGLKGTNGAFQFQLNPASIVDGKVKTGCVFIQAAPAIDKNVYDWNNQKVSFAISISDIQAIIEPDKDTNIIHKHNGLTKVFSITPGASYGYFMKLQSTDDRTKETTTVNIPLSVSEAIVLKELLVHSIPTILGWNGLETDS